MSVAGKRLGLEAEKDDTNHSSILFFEGMRVFRLAQKHCGARFLLWENVPGALTSNNGEDFGKIINSMVGVGFDSGRHIWRNEGICFGTDSMLEWSVLDAQWFGVAQRRRRLFVVLDTGNWQDRKTILLESKGLRGDPTKMRETRKETSDTIEVGTGTTDSLETFCYDMQGIGQYGDKNVASTLKGRDYKDATDLIVEQDYSCAIVSNIIGRNPETRSGGNGTGFNEEVMYTLTGADHHAVAYTTPPSMHVRRLTPIECERLQGFPDDWTKVDDKTAFSKRINALGRSMAVPVIQWIGVQIENSISK
jgi:DNA (cytosine-5)-methyltransferase 1